MKCVGGREGGRVGCRDGTRGQGRGVGDENRSINIIFHRQNKGCREEPIAGANGQGSPQYFCTTSSAIVRVCRWALHCRLTSLTVMSKGQF